MSSSKQAAGLARNQSGERLVRPLPPILLSPCLLQATLPLSPHSCSLCSFVQVPAAPLAFFPSRPARPPPLSCCWLVRLVSFLSHTVHFVSFLRPLHRGLFGFGPPQPRQSCSPLFVCLCLPRYRSGLYCFAQK